jgi:hypothetical protein
MQMDKLVVKIAVVCVFFFAMTAFKTYPLILYFGTHIPWNLGDPLLNAWILAWDFHALTTDPWNLFNANILYPVENTLAFSEHMIGVLPAFAPAYALTGNPILAYNVVLFLSFPLSGVAMFLLVHYWTRNFWASLVSGFLFAFAPIRFGQLDHLQLLNLYWAPLAFLFLARFLGTKGWGDLVGFAIFYWLQVLSSVYLGWFTTVAIGLYVLYYAFLINRDVFSRSLVPRYAAFATLTLLVLLPFHLPYYQAKQQWGFSRTIGDCVSFSADLLLSYLSAPPLLNDLYLGTFRFATFGLGFNEKQLFPGFVLPLLVALGSFPGSGFLPPGKIVQMKRIFSLILISSFILSLGPFLVVLDKNTHIPLPYLLFYYLMPGFQAMRVPARFGFMTVLAASVLAALGFLRACSYLKRLGFRRLNPAACQAMLALSCLGLFTLELGFKPLPLVKIQTGHEIPEVYRWLATKKLNGPIVELPFGFWEDYRYIYFSTYHWLPIVNGSTGFSPPTYSQIASELKALPSRRGVEFLSATGVKGIVLHTDRLQPHESLRWRQARLAELGLEKVAEFSADVVYSVLPVRSTNHLSLEFALPDRLPVGTSMRVGLLAKRMAHGPWTHPRPLGRTEAIVAWEEQRTGRAFSQKTLVELPLVIGVGRVVLVGFPLRTPSIPGRYLLRLSFPLMNISTDPQVVELTPDPVPTSFSAPQLLSAAYALEGMQSRSVTNEPVKMSLKVVNTGKAVWLAEALDGKGAVRLGWRWFKGGQEVPGTSGREPLKHDVFLGQHYAFTAKITPPLESGDYLLEIQLVSELVSWFSDQGVEPLKVAVHVLMAPSGKLDDLPAQEVKVAADPPSPRH